ncbi:MAG: hypothetical protein UHH95_01395 [Oscillospiraceae bacterium]|nr:hypothetical protein [Oscillospiraceae bacterium]
MAVKNKDNNEKVSLKLFFDGHKYVDDVTVIVNGKNYIIKRGVEVMVPPCVKSALEDATMQEREAQKYIDSVHN